MNHGTLLGRSWAVVALGLSSLAGHAQVVTWTGLGSDNYTDTAANWQGGVVPLFNGTEDFFFGPSGNHTVFFGTDLDANKVTIAGNDRPFLLDDDNWALILGAGGLVYAPASPITSTLGAYYVQLATDQTWDIQSGELDFYYDLQGTGRLTKTGAGTLIMPNYTGSWTGGVTLNGGRLVLEGYQYGPTTYTLGAGNLVIGAPGNPAPILATRGSTYSVAITNDVDLNGTLNAENEAELHLDGVVTLNTDSTISSLGEALFLNNKVTDGPTGGPAARRLTVDTIGPVVLDTGIAAPNDYSGGTHVANGPLVFANGASVPNTGLISVAATGYAGYGDETGNEQTEFLSKLDPANVHGAIGFDTDPDLFTPHTFVTPINLTGFATDARLGSVTEAILGAAAIITPQGTDYRFGGGGGTLAVDSQLTNASGPVTRNVVADSPVRHPLTVRLRNTGNDFTGTVSATHSAVIFDTGAMPAGTGNFHLGTGGYIGTAFAFTPDSAGDAALASYLAHFPAGTNTGVIGFDASWGSLNRVISNNVNLSGFAAGTYLGTSTLGYTNDGIGPGAKFTGVITPAGPAGSPYLFAGYKGGLLEIDSALSGTGGAIIGDPNSPATFGDFLEEAYSMVYLNGDNSGLSGNVQLYGGRLIVGQVNGIAGTNPTTALGSGALVVQPFPFPSSFTQIEGETPPPSLVTSNLNTIIDRPVQLNTELSVGWDDFPSYSTITLTGPVTGSGEIYVEPYTDLVLTNDSNTFSGGTYVSANGSLTVGANHATGAGPLTFGGSNVYVYFSTSAPIVQGVDSGDSDYSYFKFAQNDAMLTVNQATDGAYHGRFEADFIANATHNDSIRLVKTGPGTLRLADGGLYYNNAPVEPALPGSPKVSLQINQGRVEIGNYFYIENTTPSIWVHGGTLAVDHNYYQIYNPLVVDNGGRLAGSGMFDSAVIGANAFIGPGGIGRFSLGNLDFADLVLGPGGTYEWDLVNAGPGAGGAWDSISVGAAGLLDVTATSGTPFNIKLGTVAFDGSSALASGFDPSQQYSWTIVSSYNTTNFDPTKFTIDASLFTNSLAFGSQGDGYFSLSLGGVNGQSLMLNFTSVPEPSLIALLLTGLGLLPLAARRRKRGS